MQDSSFEVGSKYTRSIIPTESHVTQYSVCTAVGGVDTPPSPVVLCVAASWAVPLGSTLECGST